MTVLNLLRLLLPLPRDASVRVKITGPGGKTFEGNMRGLWFKEGNTVTLVVRNAKEVE